MINIWCCITHSHLYTWVPNFQVLIMGITCVVASEHLLLTLTSLPSSIHYVLDVKWKSACKLSSLIHVFLWERERRNKGMLQQYWARSLERFSHSLFPSLVLWQVSSWSLHDSVRWNSVFLSPGQCAGFHSLHLLWVTLVSSLISFELQPMLWSLQL